MSKATPAELAEIKISRGVVRLGRLRKVTDQKWGMLTIESDVGRQRHAIPIQPPDHRLRGCWCGGSVRHDSDGVYFAHERAN